MYEYIKGKITELTPAFVVVEAGNIGYMLNISLNSFTQLQNKDEAHIYTHLSIREDAHVLYGFGTTNERDVFRLLISVSGVGPNTARMMLSSMAPGEVKRAIGHENVNALKAIKGIGAKSAQRIIIDLKDKIGSETEEMEIVTSLNNTLKNEALSALEVLGFAKKNAEKTLDKLILAESDITVENLIKKALKLL